MHCRNCNHPITRLIETAVGIACPVCSYVYQASSKKANASQASEGQKLFWALVGTGALIIGLKMFFEEKNLSSAVTKLFLG